MTLAIAGVEGQLAFVLADSLVTGGANSMRERQRDYALKILSIDRSTSIAYSGSPEIAHRMVKELIDTRDLSIGNILGELSKGEGVDFIVAHGSALFEIKDSLVRRNVSASWIGQHDAFADFQERRLRLAEDGSPLGHRSHRAFTETVMHSQIQGIGGPTVSLTSNLYMNTYDRLLNLTSPRYAPPTEDWNNIDFGDAARGGYGYTTLTPPDAGICGWGIYYFQALRGLFFNADFANYTFERIEGFAKSAREFCEFLSGEVGYLPVSCGELGG